MNNLKNKAGFTLVELIVVIAILAILAGVAIPAYSGYITKAQEAAFVTELDAIKTAAQGANASAGAVTKIEITENTASGATGVVITVTGATATNFDADFELFYPNAKAITESPNVPGTFAVASVELAGDFAKDPDGENAAKSAGATWTASGWTAGVSNS